MCRSLLCRPVKPDFRLWQYPGSVGGSWAWECGAIEDRSLRSNFEMVSFQVKGWSGGPHIWYHCGNRSFWSCRRPALSGTARTSPATAMHDLFALAVFGTSITLSLRSPSGMATHHSVLLHENRQNAALPDAHAPLLISDKHVASVGAGNHERTSDMRQTELR